MLVAICDFGEAQITSNEHDVSKSWRLMHCAYIKKFVDSNLIIYNTGALFITLGAKTILYKQ